MEVLIAEIQKRNVLWNKANPYYKDRIIVDKEWDAVSQNTGFTKEEVKKKWRNLRDNFLKEFKKIPKGKSGDAQYYASIYSGKWQYFSSMLFLKDTVIPRQTEGNVPSLPQNQEDQYDQVETETDETRISENEMDTISDSSSLPPSAISPSIELQRSRSTKRKRVHELNPIEEKLLEIEPKKLSLLETREDENSLFLRSLLPYLQKMTPLQQLSVRSKIQNVILEEIMGNQIVIIAENGDSNNSTATSSASGQYQANIETDY